MCVWSAVVQWADGRIDTGHVEAPHVYVVPGPHDGLTSTQARELARQLIVAADEVDRWAAADA